MKSMWMEIVTLVAMVLTVMSASDRKPLGEIDFFGYKGFDVEAKGPRTRAEAELAFAMRVHAKRTMRHSLRSPVTKSLRPSRLVL
jgi:hypothetical protein